MESEKIRGILSKKVEGLTDAPLGEFGRRIYSVDNTGVVHSIGVVRCVRIKSEIRENRKWQDSGI